ncbi:hypothetical protein EBU71_02155 [bacterium]|nr:hypothetical protein [Candidatus Elulimicrobium humile]
MKFLNVSLDKKVELPPLGIKYRLSKGTSTNELFLTVKLRFIVVSTSNIGTKETVAEIIIGRECTSI